MTFLLDPCITTTFCTLPLGLFIVMNLRVVLVEGTFTFGRMAKDEIGPEKVDACIIHYLYINVKCWSGEY